MYIIVPPNQPVHGVGRVSKHERDQKVLAHQLLWKSEPETMDNAIILRASALFDVETMYSDERDLGIELWVVLPQGPPAAETGDDGMAVLQSPASTQSQGSQSTVSQSLQSIQSKNVFASSVLVKRKAIPGLVHCMERSKMQNFGKDLSFAQGGATNGDTDLERKLTSIFRESCCVCVCVVNVSVFM